MPADAADSGEAFGCRALMLIVEPPITRVSPSPPGRSWLGGVSGGMGREHEREVEDL